MAVLSPVISNLDAPALIRYGMPELVEAASPAAGAHFTQALPGGFYVRLLTVFCRLVTSADVADRQVVLEYRTAEGTRFALAGASTTQAASLTGDWFFSAYIGWSDFTIDSTAIAPLPPLILSPTMDFRLFVDNVQATDQLSRVKFVWERFYTTNTPNQGVPFATG